MPILPYYSQKEPSTDAVIWRCRDSCTFGGPICSTTSPKAYHPEQYAQRVLGLDPWNIRDRIVLNNHLGSLAQSREMHYINCWHYISSCFR